MPPIRCFDGSAHPFEPFWRWRAQDAASAPEPEMELYGYISEYSWFGDEITPQKFRDDLNKYGAGGPITVRINSGGGEVVAASVIRSILTDYPGKITVRIDGLCASAAVMVALAGDVVKMQDSAYLMVHDPGYSLLMGWLDISYLSGLVDMLKSIKNGMLDAYASRTGLSREKLAKMLTDETWFSASEAVKFGFADEVISGGKTADNASVNDALKNYSNVPPALIKNLQPQHTPAPPINNQQDPAQPLASQAQRLRDEVKMFI